MKTKQVILLSIALLMPVAVFLFLKGFGKNEFQVVPMFTNTMPQVSPDCETQIRLPYVIPKGELEESAMSIDSVACVAFFNSNERNRLSRVAEQYKSYPLEIYTFNNATALTKKRCIFLLQEPFDVALVDNKGRIRGQYNTSKREEIDRLITELAIIFKKY
jgi:hypothetical protein